jgi:hypothetical protein
MDRLILPHHCLGYWRLLTVRILSSLSTTPLILASIAHNTNWRAQLKLKQNDDCLSEELQSVGWLPTEKWTVQSVCNCCAFGGVRSRIKKSRLLWHMIALSIIARHRAQSVAGSISRKIREKDATLSREKRYRHTA